MTDDLVKSPMQLKYELDNTKKELISLENNWKKKKEESLGKMLNFRSELKEIDAVMAAREESYASYCALSEPILNLGKLTEEQLLVKLAQLENMQSQSGQWVTTLLTHILEVAPAAEAAETLRITRLRAEHKSQSAYIQRKSKQIYQGMSEEKKSVDDYAIVLQAKIKDLEEQYVKEIKIGGMGIGL